MKQIQETKSASKRLPVTRNLTLAYTLSLTVATMMATASVAGLLYQSTLYPTEELRQAFLANDAVNLFVGLPILLGSMWLARRGRLIGLLLWPGALLYTLYNYIAYVFGIPFSLSTVVYLAVLLLSAYSIYYLLQGIESESVQEQLAGAVPEKAAGWVLVVFGVAFFFRAIGLIAEASMSQTMLPASDIGVLVADLVLSVVWVAGGALLLRRTPLGYASGLGLLFAGSMLFIGLIVILLLQPIVSDAPFVLVDVIVVFVMGLICFIPSGLFVRGVLLTEKSS